jgi:hypothetical protein
LRCFANSACVKHLLVASQFAIEFLKLSIEDVRPENQPLKSLRPTRWSVGADHAGPPEDGLPTCGVVLLLDERRSRSSRGYAVCVVNSASVKYSNSRETGNVSGNSVNHEDKALLRLPKRAKLASRLRDDVKLLRVEREPRQMLKSAEKQMLFETAGSNPNQQSSRSKCGPIAWEATRQSTSSFTASGPRLTPSGLRAAGALRGVRYARQLECASSDITICGICA